MIVEVGGAEGGFKEYLETGRKKGRELHRDQLDQRIPLFGDLDVFEISTSAHEGEGHRYDHVTLSFSESHVTDEMLQRAVDEFRNHTFAAWPESERHRIAFYAEAHRPKMLSYTNSLTGENVERLTHIHIGIGKRDLLTGKSIEPLGFLGQASDNLKYIDAFQESFNARHGFASPKDNPKITPENAVDILARYTGAKPNELGTFNERKAGLEITLQKEVLAKNITTWEDFGKMLEAHGEVTKMHESQFNESFRVKPHGSDRAMRLKGVFFQRQFIERSTDEKLAVISDKAKIAYLEQMQPRKEPKYVASTLEEWHQTKAREIRYIHQSSKFYKEVYKPADAETRQQLLDEVERKHHGLTSSVSNHGRKENTPTRNRLPGLQPRDMDGIQSRSEMLLRDNDGVDVRTEPSGEQDRLGLRQADERGGGDGANASSAIDSTSRKSNGSSDRGDHTNSGSTSKSVRGYGHQISSSASWTEQLHELQPSNIIGHVIAEQRERYELAADKERYAEIRKNLDCAQFLSRLSHSHGLNIEKYQVATAKDGSPRIQAGSRALTPSDFLMKELGLPWKEAAPVLRQVYEHQINSQVTKPRTVKAAPSILWMDFKAMREITSAELSQRLKVFDGVAKAHRTALAEKLKAEQTATLAGLSGTARKAAHSLGKLKAATAKAELNIALSEERQILRDSIQPNQANAWRLFLQDRAQDGNEEALMALRKLDDTARAVQLTTPSIGTIILEDDEDEQKRRRLARRDYAAKVLSNLVQTVDKNSDITYRLRGHAVLRDEGRHLAVLDENSEEAIVAGLLLAREKFGSNLTLTGSPAFQQRVIEVAVAQGIAIKFVDPQLEAMRVQLTNEKRQLSRTPTTIEKRVQESDPYLGMTNTERILVERKVAKAQMQAARQEHQVQTEAKSLEMVAELVDIPEPAVTDPSVTKVKSPESEKVIKPTDKGQGR